MARKDSVIVIGSVTQYVCLPRVNAFDGLRINQAFVVCSVPSMDFREAPHANANLVIRVREERRRRKTPAIGETPPIGQNSGN